MIAAAGVMNCLVFGLRACGSFLSDKKGTIAVAFAVMLPILVGSVGMSMDVAESYLVRQRLGGTIDAAALAATASETDPAKIQARVEEFFAANYPQDPEYHKVGVTHDLQVNVAADGSSVTVSAYADYNTTFMRVLGIDKLSVYRTTTVVRQIQGLEVAMVLDNTGSMSDANKIGALQTAATNLVNILFQKTDDPSHIKIGIVPYANSVRVGRFGVGLNLDGTPFLNPDGTQATPFVTLPAGINYTTDISSSTGWYGCVIEHNPAASASDGSYDADTTMVAGSRGQLWTSSEHPYAAHGWDPSITTNDDYPQDETDDYEGPWDIYSYGTVTKHNATCSQYNCKTFHCSQPACSVHQCEQEGCQTYHCSQEACQTYNCKTFNSNGSCKTLYSGTPVNSTTCKTQYTDGDTNSAHCSAHYTSMPPTSNCKTFYTDGNTKPADCSTQYTDDAHCQTWYTQTQADSTAANCEAYYNSIPPNSNCKTFYSGTTINDTTCQTIVPPTYSYNANSQPNNSCPIANLQPLTSDQNTLLADINTMAPNGNTRGDIGIMWGYRVISPEKPFSEGSQWGDKNWRKAVIMMTDGMNTHDNSYAGDWFTTKDQLGITDYNQRFLDVCNKLKAQGVTIYTVIFGTNGAYPGPDDTTKSFYQQCASDSSKYFDSESNQALIDAFNTMANQLAQLHISQ